MRKLLVLALLLACSPAWAGDFTSPGSKAKVNGRLTVGAGGTGGPPTGDDQLLVSASKFLATWKTVPDCGGAGDTLNYTAATNTFSCGSDAGAGGGLSNVQDDTDPELGGGLDLNSFDITGTGNISITGAITASTDLTATTGDVTSGDDLISTDDVIVGDDVTLSAVDGVISIGADVTFARVDASDSLVINADVDNDAASTVLSFGVDGNGEALLSGTAFYPGANDGNALGDTSHGWSDLHLAAGGVINWANGEVTITETDANTLTVAGTTLNAFSGVITAATDVTATAGDLTAGDDVIAGDDITAPGNLTIDTSDGRIMIGDATMSGQGAATDFGIQLGEAGQPRSGLITEVDGEIVSLAMNLAQLGGRDDAKVGGIFRFDTRTAEKKFTVLYADVGAGTGALGTEAFTISLTSGAATLSNGLTVSSGNIGVTSGNLTVTAGAITATAGTITAGNDLSATDDVLVGDDLTFASGGVINWASGDCTLTHSSDTLTLAGGCLLTSNAVITGDDVTSTDDVIVGDDLTFASGGVINWAAGDCLLTHSAGLLDMTGSCDIRTDVAGTNSASVVTVGGTQTLTGKSIVATQITAGALNIGNNPATVGTVELANGTSNTLSAAAGVLSIEGAALVPTSITLTAGVGLSGGGDLSANRTFTFDATEISSATWGAGSFTTFTFDAGAVDPTETYGSGTLLTEAVFSLRQADAANAGGQIKFLEDPGTGSNFISFLAPASITADVTCTLEDDSNPIPDSCVGDGTDGGGGGLSDGDYGDITVGGTGTTLNIDGDVNIGSATPTPTIEGSDTGALGPVLTLYANSATPAAADVFGRIKFQGKDSAGNIEEYGRIDGSALSVTNTAEVGVLQFYTNLNGTPVVSVTVGAAGLGPGTTNGQSLGLPATYEWSDLFLAEGGVINWDNGDATITQTGNDITIAGITTLTLGTDDAVDIGTASIGVNDLFLGPTGTIEFNGDTGTTLADNGAGELTVEGKAVKRAGKQMMWIPAGSMKNDITSPASCGDTLDTGSNDLTISVCAFDTGATEERADFQIGMPKAWNESTVTFSTLLVCSSCSAAQTVQFELACVAISHDDVLNAAVGTAQASSVTVTAAGDLQAGAESSAITIAGTPAENDYVACRISRDTSVDNGAGDALLLGIKFFWTDNASTLAE